VDRIRNARHFAPRLQRWLETRTQASERSDGSSGTGAAQPDAILADLQLKLDLFSGGAAPARAPAPTPPSSFPIPAPATVNLLRPPVPLRRPDPSPVTPPADGMERRQVLVGGFILDYALRRSARQTVGFMVDDEGLRVTAPMRCTLADIENAIRAKQNWFVSMLDDRRQRRAARLEKPPVEWKDGATLPNLGGDITLRMYVAPRNRTTFDPATNELSLGLVQGATELLVRERVKNWYKQQAEGLFQQRLDLYAPRVGVQYASFTLSSADTRWGSCTVGRAIRLNWKLMFFSLPVIDYVVVHELAHIHEMNHSPRFWAHVGRVYPQYEEAKQLLRRRSQELPLLFS
jgi:predicted metal-dependent hydrolase